VDSKTGSSTKAGPHGAHVVAIKKIGGLRRADQCQWGVRIRTITRYTLLLPMPMISNEPGRDCFARRYGPLSQDLPATTSVPQCLPSQPHQNRSSDTRPNLRLVIRVFRLLARTTVTHSSRRAEPTVLPAEDQLQDPKSSGRLKPRTKSLPRPAPGYSSSRFPHSSSICSQASQSATWFC